MSAPTGRRASDVDGMPREDRRRWRRAQFCRRARAAAIPVWIAVAILLAVSAAWVSIDNDRDSSRRDEARKYQACDSRRVALRDQIELARITRASLTTAARRQDLQARKTQDPQLRARFELGASLARARRGRIDIPPVPECERTYPVGLRESRNYPDLAPTTPTPKAPR